MTDAAITSRIAAYKCCRGAAVYRHLAEGALGHTAEADAAWEQAELLDWAIGVLCAYPLEGGTCHSQIASTLEEVCCAVRLADPCCVCKTCVPTAKSCDLAIAYTVLSAVVALPGGTPAEGDSYYILQGLAAGQVFTYMGGFWVPVLVADYDIVLASDTGVYWTNTGNGPGLLFPLPTITLSVAPFYTVAQATTNTAQNRGVQLQVLTAAGWITVSPTWAESTLPQQINMNGLVWTDQRFVYTLKNGCSYASGAGNVVPPLDPCVPQPYFTVASAVDASFQSQAVPGTVYLIASDQYGMGNLWAANLNSILNADGTFTPITSYVETVLALDTGLYWRLIAGSMAHLYPELRATLTANGYFLESDWPSASLAGNRMVMVEAEVDGSWIIVYQGYEYDLPQLLPNYGEFTGLRATYTDGACFHEVAGTIVFPNVITEETDCSAIAYNFPGFRYPESTVSPDLLNWYPAFLFNAPPGQTITFTFLAGEMAANVVIRAYDGTDNTGTPIPSLTGFFADLTGATGTTTTNSLYIEVEAPQAMTVDLDSWIWQVGCSPTGVPPAGDITTVTKCDEYTIVVTIDITFMGDATSVGVDYSLDGGGTWTPALSGITTTGVLPVGVFPYDSLILLRLVHEQDPLANVFLGEFTNDGSCPDPCAPSGATKIDEVGDLADMPSPAPTNGWAYLVVTDLTGLGTIPIGSLMVYDSGSGTYSLSTDLPGLYSVGAPVQYWQTNGPGVQPYPLYPVPTLSQTGNSPENWELFAPDIANYDIPTNTPFKLQTRFGFGLWQDVPGATFTLQQMAGALPVVIVAPFTNAQLVWNYETCGITGGVIIETA